MKVNEFSLLELISLCEKVICEVDEKFGVECSLDEIHLKLYKVKGDLHAIVSRKENK